jgi:short-subunit dehydrogenase
MAIYGASKSAVINLCESLEIDLHKYDIHVTTLAPGFIKTPLTAENDHKMPFLMDQTTAARKIKWAIDHKKGFYAFPFPLSFMAKGLYHMPRTLYKKFMKLDIMGTGKI